MAAPMSPVVAPGRTAAMPRISASWVMSISRSAARGDVADEYMRLESPCQPSRMRVTSMLTMSPSRSGLSFGMPWQTTWLIEMQIDFGVAAVEQGRRDRRRGRGRSRRASLSRDSVATPGLTCVGEHVEATRPSRRPARAHALEGLRTVERELRCAPALERVEFLVISSMSRLAAECGTGRWRASGDVHRPAGGLRERDRRPSLRAPAPDRGLGMNAVRRHDRSRPFGDLAPTGLVRWAIDRTRAMPDLAWRRCSSCCAGSSMEC